ncbi:DUF6671 family protein [Psychroflexus planctonicus]|uniref:DUF6671 domain-containing protein n=1 Tax=Psychroflexus planctonicus TaxID=1526575 RepID=A0ABQ1SD95_9FLAO|nr:DUF6671 family protein [Psychroflexus planctonicus]GGE28593.1 hypothetical protein GCM10010832_06570 [Psychroflexus planctonicus]
MFKGRKLVIATMHGKEKVIAPIIEKSIGVHCFVNKTLNTDVFGTFTGEIDRKHDPLSTARKKCLHAMALSECQLGIASEGSFGNHPELFFAKANEEFLIFIDLKNQIEIVTKILSTKTNFNGKYVNSENELWTFAKQIGFPEHGLILRSEENSKECYKGITKREQLNNYFRKLAKEKPSVYAETDMRAFYNPTRMKRIKEASIQLIKKIQTTCPKCNCPGFDVSKIKSGLRCKQCGLPTKSTLSHIMVCKKCGFEKENIFPFQKKNEDPMYCDFCNP